MAKAETLNTRATRLETNMAEIQDVVKVLLAAQIKTEEQFRETDKHIKEMGAATGKRIQDLVSAIGELIEAQHRNGGEK